MRLKGKRDVHFLRKAGEGESSKTWEIKWFTRVYRVGTGMEGETPRKRKKLAGDRLQSR